jgi:hypothetical protein
MDVFDDPDKYPGSVSDEAEKRFQEHYLGPLGKDAGWVRLDSGFETHMPGQKTDNLLGRHAQER